MNKSLLIGVVVLVVLLAAIVIVSQLSHPVGSPGPVAVLQANQPTSQGSNNPASGASLSVSPVASPTVNSNAGRDAASQISGLLKAWYKTNAGSYADFLNNANNQRLMRQIFGNLGVGLDFYVYSTKSHYVVRTHVSNDANSYCADDSSAMVGQMVAGTDATFRAQTNCSGVAL